MLSTKPHTGTPTGRHPRHRRPTATINPRRYGDPMPDANLAAAALREHIPDAAGPRLHRLLYYMQGHHLALYGRPAYTNPIHATTDGPTIDGLGDPPPYKPGSVGDSVHSVAILVAARYGGLTAVDLNHLTRAETPWRGAGYQTIGHDLLREYFTGPGRQADSDHHTPDYVAAAHREVIAAHRHAPTEPDDLAAILAKVAGDDRR